jgi:hypothetical protein
VTDVPFHLTVMGKRFFEGTIPALVEALAQINASLATIAKRLEATAPAPAEPDRTEENPRGR